MAGIFDTAVCRPHAVEEHYTVEGTVDADGYLTSLKTVKHTVVNEDVMERDLPASDTFGVWCACGLSFFGWTRDKAMEKYYKHL